MEEVKRIKNLAAILVGLFSSVISANVNAAYPTQVMVFKPALPENVQSKSGYCFSESIAYTRSGAWRCMVDNTIYDPCFNSDDGSVICDANPITYQSGFVLKLTKPLPVSNSDSTHPMFLSQYNNGWIIKLADGSFCRPYTGSLPIVNQVAVKYSCSDSSNCSNNGNCPYMTGLLDSITTGKVWTATKIFYSVFPGTGIQIQRTQSVAITTVWQ